MKGKVSVTVNPTESLEKVVKAVQNVLGDIGLYKTEKDGLIVLNGHFNGLKDLSPLRDALSRMRIRDAARSLFMRITEDKRLSFGLHKQAAFAGHISFYSSGESSLGPIQITIEGDIDSAIEHLCH